MHHLPLFPFLPAHRARRRENEAGEGGKAHTSVSGGGRGETEEGRKTDRKRGRRRRRRRALKGFVRCFCSHGKGGGGRRRRGASFVQKGGGGEEGGGDGWEGGEIPCLYYTSGEGEGGKLICFFRFGKLGRGRGHDVFGEKKNRHGLWCTV